MTRVRQKSKLSNIATALSLFKLQSYTILAIIISFIILQDGSLVFAAQKLTRFPGASDLPSPNRLYVLRNVDNENAEPNHILFLRYIKTKQEEKLFSYGRYVEVLWSPAGNGLIINDHGGSDFSNCIVFLFNDKKKLMNVKEQLKLKMGDNKSIFRNHHVYIEGMKWISEQKLEIRITGYGDVDPDGFTEWYEYIIADGFKFLRRNPFQHDN